MKKTRLHRAAGLIVCASLLMPGCASQQMPRIAAVRYQHCVHPLTQMQAADARVAQESATAALGGGLLGATVGGAVTGSWQGALVGLGVGAAAGAAVGYTYAKIDQIADDNIRFAALRMTANQDLSAFNRKQLYAYEAMQCYITEFDQLQQTVLSGAVTREEFVARFQEIRAAMQQLSAVIGTMEQELAKTDAGFAEALAKAGAARPAEPMPADTETPSRSTQSLVAQIGVQKKDLQASQDRQDEDLLQLLEQQGPPSRSSSLQSLSETYDKGYRDTARQLRQLRQMNRQALDVMDEAAREAGIDMV